MCQRPERASLISTPRRRKMSALYTRVCQRPERASLISTNQDMEMYQLSSKMCQRPERASLISTVPSQSPHKYWLCRLIFADIYLKILKSGVFCSFSGMFTICSYLEEGACLPQHKYYTQSANKMKATLLIFYHLSFSLYYGLSLHPRSLPDAFSQ